MWLASHLETNIVREPALKSHHNNIALCVYYYHENGYMHLYISLNTIRTCSVQTLEQPYTPNVAWYPSKIFQKKIIREKNSH